MKDKALVWHRAGLGDHFVAAGLVNHVSQKYEKVFVVCSKKHNFISVSYLFSNLKNVCVLDCDGWTEDQIIGWTETNNSDLVTGMFHDYQTHLPWFEACYEQHDISPSCRYSLWPNPPDGPLSQEVAKRLIFPNTPHIIVHNSASERQFFDINLSNFPYNTNIINFSPDVSENIFDWLEVLRKAREIHLVVSSLFWMLDVLGDEINENIHFHHIRGFTSVIPEKHIAPKHPNWKIHFYSHMQWTKDTPWDNLPYTPGT